MQLVVDIGFVASLLLLALGLERLLLRPQQRKRLQAFFEAFTVTTDDFSPGVVIAGLGRPETIGLLAVVSYFWFCAIIIVALTVSGVITKSLHLPSPARDMQLARGVVCGVSLILLSRWPVPQLLHRAFSRTPSRMRLRIVAVLVFYGGSAVLLGAMLLAQWAAFGHIALTTVSTAGPWTAPALLELAFWPAYSLMWLIVAPLTLAIAAFDRPTLARGAIRALAAFLWRVVEYEKGAVSGLMLVATTVLAAVKLLYGR